MSHSKSIVHQTTQIIRNLRVRHNFYFQIIGSFSILGILFFLHFMQPPTVYLKLNLIDKLLHFLMFFFTMMWFMYITKKWLLAAFSLIILGLILSNIHTSQVTATVRLVSDTGSRGGSNNVTNGTSIIIKDAPIPVGASLELMAGNKVVLETTDQITIDCSVADKLSGTLSIMEIT